MNDILALTAAAAFVSLCGVAVSVGRLVRRIRSGLLSETTGLDLATLRGEAQAESEYIDVTAKIDSELFELYRSWRELLVSSEEQLRREEEFHDRQIQAELRRRHLPAILRIAAETVEALQRLTNEYREAVERPQREREE
jgi:hypothetical protein